MIHLENGSQFFNVDKSINYLERGLIRHVDVLADAVNYTVTCLDQIWLCQHPNLSLHSSLNRVYQCLVQFLPLLANPALETQAQLQALKRCSEVGYDAFINAALVNNTKSGIEMLELTQGLIWSQRLHYRDPQLENVPAYLADQFKSCFHSINDPDSTSSSDHSSTSFTPRDIRHNESVRIQALVQEIRALPRLNRFMLGGSYDTSCAVASKHSAVVLVNARDHSYALIFGASSGGLYESPDFLLPLNINKEELVELKVSTTSTRAHRGGSKVSEIDDCFGPMEERGIGLSRVPRAMTAWSRQMGVIWHKITKPILDHLKLEPTSGHARPRLYWCPTGIFGRLPLHAAGIYEDHQTFCCSDYVVSTYTPTLTTLARAQQNASPMHRNHVSVTVAAEKQAMDPTMELIPQVDNELEQVVNAIRSHRVEITHCIAGSTTVSDVSRAIQSSNIMHLACHGVQDTNDALQSGFCLGDGRLTIADLMILKIEQPFLAFLSACETAKGDKDQPDQAMHLAAAMLFCGYTSVIATMWAINDSDGPKVARWFYEELFAQEIIDVDSIAYTLDMAVAKLRASGVPPDRWAPFIHMGA